jgi:hypothetical protein
VHQGFSAFASPSIPWLCSALFCSTPLRSLLDLCPVPSVLLDDPPITTGAYGLQLHNRTASINRKSEKKKEMAEKNAKPRRDLVHARTTMDRRQFVLPLSTHNGRYDRGCQQGPWEVVDARDRLAGLLGWLHMPVFLS